MKSMLKQFGWLSALMLLTVGTISAGVDSRLAWDVGMENIPQEETRGFLLDLGDLSGRSEADIEVLVRGFIEEHLSLVPADLNCKVSVTGKVTVGVASIDITVEVSGPCSQVRAQGRQIANQVLSELKQALK